MRMTHLALLITFLLFLGACSHVSPTTDRLVVARTDNFVLTQSELDEWTTFLEQRRDSRRQLQQAGNRYEEIARAAAVTSILLDDHGELVSDEERRHIRRDTADRNIRRTYIREVLAPQVIVEEARIRDIFENHRENYQKARGVAALEIFLWAPEDLKALRREKMLLLKDIRESTATREAFRKAALEYSDATSAFRGGSIGTLLEDQVGSTLQQALFTKNKGLTEIVENPEGLFLFWVVRRIDAKENDFEDVAGSIEAKLRQREMQTLIKTDAKELRTRHSFTLVTRDIPPTKNTTVLRFGDTKFTLSSLDLGSWDIKAIERRGMSLLYGEILQNRGNEYKQPDQIETDWIVSRRILKRLIAQKQNEDNSNQGNSDEYNSDQDKAKQAPLIERWTFSLLTIENVRSPEALFAVFRARHDLGETANLADLRLNLENTYGLPVAITHFDDVLASSVGGLGPEIHTTLKKHLLTGEICKPIHLMDQHQVVVIALENKRVDEQASRATASSSSKKRTLKNVENRIAEELLQSHGFQIYYDK